MIWLFLFLLLVFTDFADAQGTVRTPKGVLNYTEDWGYVDVRDSAHTFWWLFQVPSDTERPLILWLQGGPGSDSTGFGNLDEIGPKNVHLQDRNYTWLQLADLVFVDNPVGAGFSYVTDRNAFAQHIEEIGQDLVVWAKAFFQKHPEYQKRPFYVVGESYGGKMTTEFTRQLLQAVERNEILVQLGGIGLVDSWISPIDFVQTWGPYLFAQSYLDEAELTIVQMKAQECQQLVDFESWPDATTCWAETKEIIGDFTGNVSFYNVLKANGTDVWSKKASVLKSDRLARPPNVKERAFQSIFGPLRSDIYVDVMESKMRSKFGIIPPSVHFGAQTDAVFTSLWGDFMGPVVHNVDELLARGVKVSVLNGQLDLICDTMGVERWLRRLQWQHIESFLTAPKKAFASKYDANAVDGFLKEYKNLRMAYILRGGHMTAHDAPWATLEAIRWMLQN